MHGFKSARLRLRRDHRGAPFFVRGLAQGLQLRSNCIELILIDQGVYDRPASTFAGARHKTGKFGLARRGSLRPFRDGGTVEEIELAGRRIDAVVQRDRAAAGQYCEAYSGKGEAHAFPSWRPLRSSHGLSRMKGATLWR